MACVRSRHRTLLNLQRGQQVMWNLALMVHAFLIWYEAFAADER